MYISNVKKKFLNAILYFSASCIIGCVDVLLNTVPSFVCMCVCVCVCATVNCFQFLCFAFDKVETVSSFYIK